MENFSSLLLSTPIQYLEEELKTVTALNTWITCHPEQKPKDIIHNSPLIKVNYIRHLNAFFSVVRSDNRLTSSHVSLYLALFQYWNFNRFQNPFPVYRENIMQLSRIGSKNTYHKCVKQLHQAQYIVYHPAAAKYQPVRISMIRLDMVKEISSYKQLGLFPLLEGAGVGYSTNNETAHVSHLTGISPNSGTLQVPDSGHLIKPNLKKRETLSTDFFKKDKKKTEKDAGKPLVSNLIHTEIDIPDLSAVKIYFQHHNYLDSEAKKFYNHYKALGWKIQGRTPIADWKPLVEKWMANTLQWENNNQKQPVSSPALDIRYLFQVFLDGKKIFHHLTDDHFDILKLQVSDALLQQARLKRINQVAGTNQHSLNQLWDAYLKNDENHPLVQKDKAALIALAKKIAVISYFHSQKKSGLTTLPP